MRYKFLIIGLVAYLILLPVTLPAHHFLAWFDLSKMDVAVGNVGGTTWAGHIEGFRYKEIELDKVRWKFKPLQLLLGRLEFQTKASGTQSRGRADIGRSLLGSLTIQDVQAQVSAEDINVFLPPDTIDLGGILDVKLESVTYKEGFVDGAGVLVWKNARISLAPESFPLGDLQLTLHPADTGLRGTLIDLDGPIGVEGELSLTPDGAYQIVGTLEPRTPLPKQVRQVLPLLGISEPDAQGRYELNFSGNL